MWQQEHLHLNLVVNSGLRKSYSAKLHQYKFMIAPDSPRLPLPLSSHCQGPSLPPCLRVVLSVSAVCTSVHAPHPNPLQGRQKEGYGCCTAIVPEAGAG
jgi:hypothetical protein